MGRPHYAPGGHCSGCQLSPLSETPARTPTPLSGQPGHSPAPSTQLPDLSPLPAPPGTEPQRHWGQLPVPGRGQHTQAGTATEGKSHTPAAHREGTPAPAITHLFTPALCGPLRTPGVRPRLPDVAGGGGCRVPHQPPQRSFSREDSHGTDRERRTQRVLTSDLFLLPVTATKFKPALGNKGDSLVLGACISGGPGETRLSHGWIQGLNKQCPLHSAFTLLVSARLTGPCHLYFPAAGGLCWGGRSHK